jgi:hypothetical protein
MSGHALFAEVGTSGSLECETFMAADNLHQLKVTHRRRDRSSSSMQMGHGGMNAYPALMTAQQQWGQVTSSPFHSLGACTCSLRTALKADFLVSSPWNSGEVFTGQDSLT